mmetsp:Transcript_30542/g.45989  ORF Transcript_30542/g.45989 Transcript_30542/m.45989 type:complete len:96 (-) Transcript_30542:138-425(-)
MSNHQESTSSDCVEKVHHASVEKTQMAYAKDDSDGHRRVSGTGAAAGTRRGRWYLGVWSSDLALCPRQSNSFNFDMRSVCVELCWVHGAIRRRYG